MAHSYTSCLYHCVFSTKGRRQLIPADVQPQLWPYIGGIARANEFTARAVGGTADHVHVLMSLPATLPIAKAVQLVKAGSSKWLRESFPMLREFAWQEGYGAFSIGVAQLADTVRYIENQAAHHRMHSFEDEYRAFLERNAIEFDERHVFG
ncbi:MAG: IS200/IS605 family transposase [Planctomycetota bacterium]